MTEKVITSDELVIANDPPALFAAAAEAFVDLAEESVRSRGRFCVVLSGGRTPKGLHEQLVQSYPRDRLDWRKVDFFWGDERTVPPDHPDSNFRMASETLLQPLAIKKEQVHRLHTELADWPKCAEVYQRRLAEVLEPQTSSPPPLDLVLLGMGDDGHTASLFPFTEALQETQRWVVANHVPQLQTDRLTLTAPFINAARNVWFLITGESKAARLAQVLNGPYDPERLPSQLIRPVNGKLKWFVDEAASRELGS